MIQYETVDQINEAAKVLVESVAFFSKRLEELLEQNTSNEEQEEANTRDILFFKGRLLYEKTQLEILDKMAKKKNFNLKIKNILENNQL